MTNASLKLEALEESIYSKVLEVIRLLRESKRRIVLAESCTGGLAAAWFTSVPGASDVFCGSMVVYRNDTKSQWLGLDPNALANPKVGSVGSWTSNQLAKKVMLQTPEADVSIAITGHLGPNAPEVFNGRIFIAGMIRSPERCLASECRLSPADRIDLGSSAKRRILQQCGVLETLRFCTRILGEVDGSKQPFEKENFPK